MNNNYHRISLCDISSAELVWGRNVERRCGGIRTQGDVGGSGREAVWGDPGARRYRGIRTLSVVGDPDHNEKKKVKGTKTNVGTGRITKMAAKKKEQQAQNKAFADRGKKAGFKSTQDYANTVARYGGEKNYKDPNKYGGLGS